MHLHSVLCVDDSPTELRLMVKALEGEGTGLKILQAMDGEAALRMAMEHQPDLILLDIILPKTNGFQVCRQLKTVPETAKTKIILVSAKTRSEDRFWGIKQGADDYITKPFSRESLVRRILRHLQPAGPDEGIQVPSPNQPVEEAVGWTPAVDNPLSRVSPFAEKGLAGERPSL